MFIDLNFWDIRNRSTSEGSKCRKFRNNQTMHFDITDL